MKVSTWFCYGVLLEHQHFSPFINWYRAFLIYNTKNILFEKMIIFLCFIWRFKNIISFCIEQKISADGKSMHSLECNTFMPSWRVLYNESTTRCYFSPAELGVNSELAGRILCGVSSFTSMGMSASGSCFTAWSSLVGFIILLGNYVFVNNEMENFGCGFKQACGMVSSWVWFDWTFLFLCDTTFCVWRNIVW